MTTTIRASVGNKVLQQADRYFTNSTAGIIAEAVQNARRAGATTISFELAKVGERASAHAGETSAYTLLISDNGRGLAREDAGILLTFAGSKNDEAVEVRESAAGIGFFSLAHHDVTVSSRDWTMTVPKAAFRGAADATLTDAPGEPVDGLSILVSGIETTPMWAKLHYGSIVREETRYAGLRVTMKGFAEGNGIHEPESFIGQDVGTVVSEILVEDLGVTLKVSRVLARDASLALNFHGKVISPKWLKDQLTSLEAKDKVSIADPSLVNSYYWTKDHEMAVSVLVDVRETTTVSLQLPHRDEIVVDAGAKRLWTLIAKTVARLYAGQGHVVQEDLATANGLAMTSPVRKLAKSLGLEVSLPRTQIDGYWSRKEYVSLGDGRLQTRKGEIVEHGEIVVANMGSMLAEMVDSSDAPHVFDRDEVVKTLGEGPYARLTYISFIAKMGDDEHELPMAEAEEGECVSVFDGLEEIETAVNDDDAFEALADTVVDDITVRLVITDAKGLETERYLGADAIFWVKDYCADDVGLILKKDGDDNNVVNSMISVADWESDDISADSHETQKDYYRAAYKTAIAKIRGTGLDIMVDRIRDATRSAAWDFDSSILPEDGEVTITITLRRDPEGNGRGMIVNVGQAKAPVAQEQVPEAA